VSEPTIAELVQRLDEQEAMIAELQDKVAVLEAAEPAAPTVAPEVHLYKEITVPAPISQPIDFQQMAMDLGAQHSWYDESTDWNPGGYI
jgi:hypothetical protein